MGNGLCHLTDILYDGFYITALRHQYVTYQYGSMGRNHVTGKMAAA